MEYKELSDKVALMFPMERGEDVAHYEFFLSESLEPFKHMENLDKAWERIREYDGNTKRPKFSFFYAIAKGTKASKVAGFEYYKCQCGSLLSPNSNGGCPICHSTRAEWRMSKKPVEVIPCQSPCFDCSIYSETAFGPSCQDYGTDRFPDCKERGRCKCVKCCQYTYLSKYHPERLRDNPGAAIAGLLDPISEQGKAFHSGSASIVDIWKMLEWREKERGKNE